MHLQQLMPTRMMMPVESRLGCGGWQGHAVQMRQRPHSRMQPVMIGQAMQQATLCHLQLQHCCHLSRPPCADRRPSRCPTPVLNFGVQARPWSLPARTTVQCRDEPESWEAMRDHPQKQNGQTTIQLAASISAAARFRQLCKHQLFCCAAARIECRVCDTVRTRFSHPCLLALPGTTAGSGCKEANRCYNIPKK